jgi:transcriptional regulator with XRE-family HTH domain
MAHPILPSYLHTLRMQWGLSQAEFAELLGISASALCKIETLARRPSAKLLLASQIVLGLGPDQVFPGLYRSVERDILRRARNLYDEVEIAGGRKADAKLRMLSEIIARTETRS